ncbi:MAG TPA: hypothetical protein VF607_09680, partial [Verrucomicrobiae bacterium]
MTQSLFGANSYWDINGATAGAGGATPSGLWSGANWSTSSAGTAATASWTSGNTAIFSAGTDATGSYTITLSGTQNASALSFATGTATLTGGTLSLAAPGNVSVTTKGIVSSLISGSAGLTKAGSGELLLSGANTFTGNLTNRAGILTLDNNSAGGAADISLNPNGSPVTLHSSVNGTELANNINMVGSSSTVEIDADNNNTLTLDGTISGPHNWTANGRGTLVLAGS